MWRLSESSPQKERPDRPGVSLKCKIIPSAGFHGPSDGPRAPPERWGAVDGVGACSGWKKKKFPFSRRKLDVFWHKSNKSYSENSSYFIHKCDTKSTAGLGSGRRGNIDSTR